MWNADILIVGAGISGLTAAAKLSAAGYSVLLIEARERAGGRICSFRFNREPGIFEAGAEFVHGQLEATFSLLKEAGIGTTAVTGAHINTRQTEIDHEPDDGNAWEYLLKERATLEQDIPFADFLLTQFGEEKYRSLRTAAQGFAEGFDLADIQRASTKALLEEWDEEDQEQYRVNGGYGSLVEYLVNCCLEQGVKFFYEEPVVSVKWNAGEIEVVSDTGTKFTTKKIILTIPLGILQKQAGEKGSILFDPALAVHQSAFREMGFGSVIKILLLFREAFWEKKFKHAGFIFGDAEIPTWWTQLPATTPLLTGWIGGPATATFRDLSTDQILEKCLESIELIFSYPKKFLRESLLDSAIVDWGKDSWACGGYSYSTPQTATAITLLQQPVEDRIYFCGEALYSGTSPGTVEAAICSALDVIKQILLK